MLPETRRTPAEAGAHRQEWNAHHGISNGHGTAGPAVLYRIPLPLAEDAEQHLAGCAAASRAAALMALDRVSMFDFADQRCWEVIVAGAVSEIDDTEERIEAIARRVEMEPALLRHWVDQRPVMADKSGSIARKVTTAAEHRHRVLAMVRDLEALGAELVTQ